MLHEGLPLAANFHRSKAQCPDLFPMIGHTPLVVHAPSHRGCGPTNKQTPTGKPEVLPQYRVRLGSNVKAQKDNGCNQMKNMPQNNKPSNNANEKSTQNELFNTGVLGGMLGGNMSRLLLRTRNQTLTEYVGGLHGWVKKPKNKK